MKHALQHLPRIGESLAALLTRVTVGYGFYLTGKGKLANLDGVIEYFQSLGVPMAPLQAPMVAGLEWLGGIGLILGLATRPLAALLATTMIVALRLADGTRWMESWTPTSEIVPVEVVSYTYLLMLLWLLARGGGGVSLDKVLTWFWWHRKNGGSRCNAPTFLTPTTTTWWTKCGTSTDRLFNESDLVPPWSSGMPTFRPLRWSTPRSSKPEVAEQSRCPLADLRTCQSWLQEQIVGGATSAAQDWVREEYGLDAARRVDIYREMYPARMLEALQTDYPGTAWALGAGRFYRVVREYVEKHPSRSWTLNRLGDHFPEFLCQLGRRANTFVRELASLERELCRVFEAPEVPALAPGPPPERLRARPTSALLRYRYPVSGFLEEVDRGRQPQPPAREVQYVLVFRHRFQMQRHHLSHQAWQLLHWLWGGMTLEDGLYRFSRKFPEVDAMTIQEWFQDWVRWEIFAQ